MMMGMILAGTGIVCAKKKKKRSVSFK